VVHTVKKSMMASAQLLQSSALHPTDWCHINFPREKSATPCNAAFLQNSLTACCQIDMSFCHHINVAALRFRTVELIRLVVFGLGLVLLQDVPAYNISLY